MKLRMLLPIVIATLILGTPAFAATATTTQSTTPTKSFTPGTFTPPTPQSIVTGPSSTITIPASDGTLTATDSENWSVQLSGQVGAGSSFQPASVMIQPPDVVGPLLSSTLGQPTPLIPVPTTMATAQGQKGTWDFQFPQGLLSFQLPPIYNPQDVSRPSLDIQLTWSVIQTPAPVAQNPANPLHAGDSGTGTATSGLS